MSIVVAVLVGVLCGTHAATWGAYKDSPFEGFKVRSFVRSVLLASVVALVLAQLADLTGSLLLLIGVCYAGERLVTEWWKSVLREDDQSAYAIPMRLAVHGRPINERWRRYALGVAVAAGVAGAGWAASRAQAALPSAPAWAALVVAGAGGWLTAVGGAWKDAPIEGFSGWKFLRSPVVATGWGIVLSGFTHDWLTLAVAAGGWSVISIETYKTFLTGNRPPGKFDGRPIRFAVRPVREACRAAHVAVYAVLALALGPRSVGSLPQALVILVSLAAAMTGGLVLAQPRDVRILSPGDGVIR